MRSTWARALGLASAFAMGGIAAAAPRKPGPPKHTAVHVPCPDTLPDGTPADPHLTETLVALAGTVAWTTADGPPSTCHRSVHLVCGPDLDGDGTPEALVQIVGWSAVDDSPCGALKSGDEHWLLTHTFLASRPASTPHAIWRALARVDVGLAAANPDAEGGRQATFVRRARGTAAVRVDWSSLTSDSGCRIAGYEVLELRAGSLHRVELGDNSRSCSVCDCAP